MLEKILHAVGDVFEFGPVEAVRINREFIPEAERAARRIMRNINDSNRQPADYSEEVKREAKLLKIILGKERAENKEESEKAAEYYDLILKENAYGDEERVMGEAEKILEICEQLIDPAEAGKGKEDKDLEVMPGTGKINHIRENMDTICDILGEEIIKSDIDEDRKKDMLKRLRKLYHTETNIMLVGATGCGKSSTVNALFACSQATGTEDNGYVEVARVGSKADPETKDIEKYRIGNLVLWDTPGLGDGTEIDRHHKEVIRELLREKDKEGNALIDLVLVILDGSTKDLGTSYKILNDVIIPEMGDGTERILIALNQADIAMKTGRHWDYEKNEPDGTLKKFLEEKVGSIKKRINEGSGLEVAPIYYCAGYQEESGERVYPYNLSKLLLCILEGIPAEKRMVVIEGINTDPEFYEYNDGESDYNEEIKESVDEFFRISEGINAGAEIGNYLLGLPGMAVGGVIGGIVGCIRGILESIF